ncbi:MAG: DUF2818 family protein [Cycloclasticus sp.]|jgi:hypothetical protein|nr:MAG: hypothetical protein AXW16_02370 [Cycloclasticus sp. Phe_18]MBV1912409.1 DUF2818 family protein [Cycloclasticus sp.]MDF1688205.1 DUF2818 family protein [Cycloclasticus sp.]MEE4290605.1 DUF2818 family protein [Cycloclasticus sp.]
MNNQYPIYIFLFLTIITANLPWLSDKFFCIRQVAHKSGWLRWFEWLSWYGVSFFAGFMLEYKIMGTRTNQDWEFYVVTLCLFFVFALPGFIYHYDLKKILSSR